MENFWIGVSDVNILKQRDFAGRQARLDAGVAVDPHANVRMELEAREAYAKSPWSEGQGG